MRRIPADISSTTFDVVIVGAGVNGCGVARDAAMRGLRVLLLDKSDISAGATARGALRRMMRAPEAAIAEGRPIVIFPEGSRVPVGEQPPLQPGFGGAHHPSHR